MELLTAREQVGGLIVFSSAKLPPAFGLANLGATCWFNALTQALVTCTAFTTWLREEGAGAGGLCREFGLLAQSPVGGVVVPHNLLAALREKLRDMRRANTLFAANGNESACEGLTLVIEMMDAEARLKPNDTIMSRFQHDIDEWVECGHCARRNGVVQTTAIHFEIFGAAPQTPEDFMAALMEGAGSPVDGDYKCEHCENGKQGKAGLRKGGVRKVALRRVREVLVVLFNRYGAAQGGSTTAYCPPKVEISGVGGKAVYQLVAQIEHSGSLQGGHYWAHALREKNARAVQLNDAVVQPEDKLPQSPQTYMAFYHFVGLLPRTESAGGRT
jgi:ubiquitin C-terminal hydrolase